MMHFGNLHGTETNVSEISRLDNVPICFHGKKCVLTSNEVTVEIIHIM